MCSSDLELSDTSNDWGKNFTLMNDISLSEGSPMNTIGNETNQFTGTFDGQSNTISNFTIDKAGFNNIGLFGYLGNNGEIKDLTVETAVAGVRGESNVGILLGQNYGKITRCSSSGNVTATLDYAGGLVGYNNQYKTVEYCYSTGNVTAQTGAEIGRASCRERV